MARLCTKAELLALAESDFEPISPDDIAVAAGKIYKIRLQLKREEPDKIWAPWEQ